MIKIVIEINSESYTIKYQKIKQIKSKTLSEAFEIFERFKKLAQMFKKQSNFVDITKQILNTSIEIRFRKLFKIFSKLSR